MQLALQDITPRILLNPKHSCFSKVTKKTKMFVVGAFVTAIMHKCNSKEEKKLLVDEPMHFTAKVSYCEDCDTLYVFEYVPFIANFLGSQFAT